MLNQASLCSGGNGPRRRRLIWPRAVISLCVVGHVALGLGLLWEFQETWGDRVSVPFIFPWAWLWLVQERVHIPLYDNLAIRSVLIGIEVIVLGGTGYLAWRRNSWWLTALFCGPLLFVTVGGYGAVELAKALVGMLKGQNGPPTFSAPASTTVTGSLPITVQTEDGEPVAVQIELKTGDPVPRSIARFGADQKATFALPLDGLVNGDYFVYFSAPGYAARWERIRASGAGGVWPSALQIKLFRKRYVVLRYAFNPTNRPELTGDKVVTGRVVLAHWGHLPYFGEDWQVWQQSNSEELFGDTLFLNFHRLSAGDFGFLDVPAGKAFDDLKAAPSRGAYRTDPRKAVKGLALFCRVKGNRPGHLGYGKILVEDVTAKPPDGVTLLDNR